MKHWKKPETVSIIARTDARWKPFDRQSGLHAGIACAGLAPSWLRRGCDVADAGTAPTSSTIRRSERAEATASSAPIFAPRARIPATAAFAPSSASIMSRSGAMSRMSPRLSRLRPPLIQSGPGAPTAALSTFVAEPVSMGWIMPVGGGVSGCRDSLGRHCAGGPGQAVHVDGGCLLSSPQFRKPDGARAWNGWLKALERHTRQRARRRRQRMGAPSRHGRAAPRPAGAHDCSPPGRWAKLVPAMGTLRRPSPPAA